MARDICFDKRASRYDTGWEGRASRRFYNLLLQQVKLFPGASVLDVGCGTGTVLRRMADDCEINGFGIDIGESMLAEARSKCPEMNFQISRCEKMPFDNQSFDVVVTCMAYHHFSDKEGFAKEAARVLKSGGSLYIADLRLPWIIRRALSGAFRLFRVAGEFLSADEITASFVNFGFERAGVAFDGFAQVVSLRKA